MRKSISGAVSSALAVMERDSSSLGNLIDRLHRKFSLQLNGDFWYRGVGVLKEKDYCAPDIVLPVLCGFIDRVTRCIKSPNMTRVHVTYSLLMSRAVSGSWKRGYTSEELKAIGTEVCEF